jgi:hypothetical protein
MIASLLVTRSRIALITAVGGLIAAIAAGGAKIALSASKLEDLDRRTTSLETRSQNEDVEAGRISTALDDMKATLNRIEDRLDKR